MLPLSYPASFVQRMQAQLPQNEINFFWEALQTPATTATIRLNAAKNNPAPYHQLPNIPWCQPEGKILPQRPFFALDPLWHAGAYYVQEAGSMFIHTILTQHLDFKNPIKVLDLCAAPGGKSTLIANLLTQHPQSLLVANEVIKTRTAVLAENLTKWGYPNTYLTNNDPQDFTPHFNQFFDVVLIDAPCSGEGLFRKDKNAINEWSEHNQQTCVARQRRILQAAQQLVAPQGLLIYTTCTYAPTENEKNMQWFLNSYNHFEPLNVILQNEWNIQTNYTPTQQGNCPSYHFYPHKTPFAEGFFACVLKNKNQNTPQNIHTKKINTPKSNLIVKKTPDTQNWLPQNEPFTYYNRTNSIEAILNAHVEYYQLFSYHLTLKKAGITALEPIKNNQYMPTHALVINQNFNPNAFPVIEVNQAQALNFLRKQPLDFLNENNTNGYLLISYEKNILGFVKNVGNRYNNYYPKEWRLLKQ